MELKTMSIPKKYPKSIFVLLLLLFAIPNIGNTQIDCNTTLSFEIDDITGNIGDIQCIDIKVNNFIDVESIQLTINFDPNVLAYQSCVDNSNLGVDICNTSIQDTSIFTSKGFIKFLWYDLTANGVTLNDGDILLSFCFEILGEPNDQSFITLTNDPLEFEVGYSFNGVSESYDLEDVCIDRGDVNINCNIYNVYASSCFATANNSFDGTISFYTCGGTAPYTYTVTGGISGSSLNNEVVNINNLNSGTYTVTIIDAASVMRDTTLNIIIGNNLMVTIDSMLPSCAVSEFFDGMIELTTTGGTAPYSYTWDNYLVDTNSRDKLQNGTYTVTIQDVNGCKEIQSFTLLRDTLKLDISLIKPAVCARRSNSVAYGMVAVNVSGGQPNMNGEFTLRYIDITNSMNERTIAVTDGEELNIPFGIYNFYVYDATSNSCTSDTIQFEIPVLKTINGSFNTPSLNCFGDDNAEITIDLSATGGSVTPIIRYELSRNNTIIENISLQDRFHTFGNLSAGDYIIETTDGNGCPWDTTFTLSSPPEIVTDSIQFTVPDCETIMPGSIEVLATGGVGNFTYLWNDQTSGPINNNINAGTYSVVVTDQNNCLDTFSLDIPNIGDLQIDTTIITSVGCDGNSTGSITIMATSSEPISYDWGEGPILGENMRTGLSAGFYTVTVSTSMGCDIPITREITSPATFSITPVETSPLCPGGNGNIGISVSPSSGQYNYEWNHPNNTGFATLAGVPAGNYMVTVSDGSGCQVVYDLELHDPERINVTLDLNSIVEASCSGKMDGELTANASGGTVGNNVYLFTWSSGEMGSGTSNRAFNLLDGMQYVVVSDRDCVADTSFFTVPAGPSPSVDIDNSTFIDPTCFGSNNGMITIQAMGGDGNYSYSWTSLNSGNDTISNLSAGMYPLVITDRNACVFRDTFELIEPPLLTASIDTINTINLNCNGLTSGQITVTAEGGNSGGYNYSWPNNESTNATASMLSAGNYQITVTDNKQCIAIANYTLTMPEAVIADVAIPDDIVCYNGRTALHVNSASGGSGIGYVFSPVQGGVPIPITDSISVSAGTYTITVFDNVGCSYDTTIIISQPNEFVINAGPDQEIRLGDSTILNLDPLNLSLGADSIFWTNNDVPVSCIDPMTCLAIEIAPTNDQLYKVSVTDSDGCTATDEVFITIDNTRGVYLPNVFAPNSESVTRNNKYSIGVGNDVYKISQFFIYDRWGNLVYEALDIFNNSNSNDPESSLLGNWDGNYNGNELPTGVYLLVASIDFKDGVSQEYRQSVTLVR